MSQTVIAVEDVEKKLRNVDISRAPGPYDPHMRIPKIFAKWFAIPLVEIFN